MKKIFIIGLLISNYFAISQSKSNNFVVSTNYGLGYRTASIQANSSFERDLLEQLSSGKSIEIKAGYKFNRQYFGLIYSNFSSSGQINNVSFTEPNGFNSSGSIKSTHEIYFIGVGGGLIEKGFYKNDSVLFDIYLGYINFKEITKLASTYTTVGDNLGLSVNISYYIGVNKYIKFGPSLSFNGGALKTLTMTGNNGYLTSVNMPEKSYFSLYRVDIMIGAQIQF